VGFSLSRLCLTLRNYLEQDSNLTLYDSLLSSEGVGSSPNEFDLDSFTGLLCSLFLLRGITGITFVDVRNKLFLEGEERMRKYELSGHSHGLWFILIFSTVESALQIQSMELKFPSTVYPFVKEFAK
jgi:hypothetical protein